MVSVYRADIHLRVSLCELSQDMVNSAALWFIQQSHHLAYPHNKHPTWNLPTLTIEIKNIRYIKPLETVWNSKGVQTYCNSLPGTCILQLWNFRTFWVYNLPFPQKWSEFLDTFPPTVVTVEISVWPPWNQASLRLTDRQWLFPENSFDTPWRDLETLCLFNQSKKYHHCLSPHK